MNNFSAIILAAGQGKRMNSDISKVMHKISGKPLIDWVYTKLKEAGCENHVVVIGHKKEQVEEYFKDSVNYAIQDKMLGTGHAVMMCEDYFKGENKTVMVLCGDAPLISKELIENTIKSHKESNASATVVSAIVNDATGYGRIIKDENENLLKIVEHKDATDEEKKVNEINSGMYCFESKDLFNALSKIKNDNAQGARKYAGSRRNVLRNHLQRRQERSVCRRLQEVGEYLHTALRRQYGTRQEVQ